MTGRHYAPRARVVLARSSDIAPVIDRELAAGKRLGAIVIGADATGATAVQRLPADAAGYAHGLYAAMHAVDDAGCDIACVELPPDAPEWAGVNDRLRRAAHPPERG